MINKLTLATRLVRVEAWVMTARAYVLEGDQANFVHTIKMANASLAAVWLEVFSDGGMAACFPVPEAKVEVSVVTPKKKRTATKSRKRSGR